MVICGSFIFEFGVNKDMKRELYNKGSANRGGSGTFLSNANYQETKN
jgi:hypothetical protein